MPFEHFRPWERALLRLGLVRRNRYTDRVARGEAAELRLATANGIVGKQLDELHAYERRVCRLSEDLAQARDELREQRDAATLQELRAPTPDEAALLAVLRAARERTTEAWSDDQAEGVRALLLSPAGALVRDEMFAWASGRMSAAARCAPGGEARALGYAQGAQEAAFVLHHFTAPVARAEATPDETA